MITWATGDALRDWVAALPTDEVGAREPLIGYRALWSAFAEASRGADVARIGTSVDGEPIWAASLDDRHGAPGRTTLVLAGLHAMEHIGPAVALRLLERASTEPRWRGQRLVVAPLLNPDGFRDVCADLAAGRRRFRRKNRRAVDLNRNFAHHAAPLRAGWRGRLQRRFFHPGEHPLSEPEAQALDHLIRDVAPQRAVSLHAFGRWIYLPWAGSRERPAAAAQAERIAARMVATQPVPYRVVSLARRSRFFRAFGTELDHLHAAGALAFLVEIGPGPRVSRPGGWLHPYRWYTPTADDAEPEIQSVIAALEVLSEIPGTNDGGAAS